MQKRARVRRWVFGLSFVALALLGVVRRPAAQGQFVSVTIHMIAEPGLYGRVGAIPIGTLCDVNDQNGDLQPDGSRTSQCTYQIAAGTALRLTSNVPGGSGMPGVFSNPTGSANCGPFSTCLFTITEDSDVTATFSNATPTYTMTVNVAGAPGEVGTDNSRCQTYDYHPSELPTQGTVCVTRYAQGSTVTTDAWPPVGSRFAGYSQGTHDAAACGTTALCAFPLTADTAITASFSALTSIAVSPSSQTVGIGEIQIFSANGSYDDGNVVTLPPFHMGTWVTRNSMAMARFSFGATAVGNRIYAIGGSSTGGPLASAEVYDPSTNGGRGSWSSAASLPLPLAGFGSAASDDRYIYAAGGSTSGACPVETLLRYDAATDAWETRAPMPGGPRRFLTAAVVGRTLYAIGGELNLCGTTVGTSLNRVEAYDLDTDTWTSKAPMPTSRRFLAAGVVNGIIYVIGGDNAGDAAVSATVEAYDPASNSWSTRAPLPSGRTLLAVGVIDDVLYAVGGLENGSYRNSLSAYDASTNTWSNKLAIPAVQYEPGPNHEFGGERAELAVASLGGRLYALGGLGGPGPSIPQNNAFVLAFSDGLIWSTSSPAVASIDQNFTNGLARGLSVGSTGVVARSGAIACAPGACGVLNVTNGPPGVTVGSPNPRTIQEGQSISVSGNFSDFAADGPWTASISFGDGSPAESLGSFSSPGFFNTSNHLYKDNGTFSAVVSVTDSHGNTGTGTLQVIVTNVAPQVFLGTSASVNVGSTSPFTCATFSDPGVNDGPWTAIADFGDGTGPQTVTGGPCGGGGGNPPTGSFLLSHSYSHAGTFTLTLTVTDKDGAAGSSTTQVTANLAQINLSIPGSTSTQVNNANWGCGTFFDPNGGSWTGTINYGDGGGNQGLPLTVPASGPCASGGGSPSGSFSFNHAYGTAGTYAVSLTITNTTTGGSRSGIVTVNVTAAQIFLSLPNSASTQVNSTSNFGCGSFSDGNGGSWTGMVNYGDGAGNQPLALIMPPSGTCNFGGGNPPTGVFALSHTYHAAGPFTVTVTIMNTVTLVSRSGSFSVTVNAAQMSVGLPPSASINVDMNNWGCGSFTDPNGGSWLGSVNYGDGSGAQPLTLVVPPSGPCASGAGGGTPPTGVFSLDHAYSVGGTFPVSVTIRNTVTGTSKSSGFLVTVTDNRCAQVTLIISGNVPFTTLPVSVTWNGVPEGDGDAIAFGTNVLKVPVGEEGTYHVVFHPPAGYAATPDHLDFTVVCGTNRSFSVVVAPIAVAPPVITSLTPSNASLWPPNHKYQAVSFAAVAVDAAGNDISASCRIVLITSNEPDNGLGDDDTANDSVITGPLSANLRAERSASGGGRVYTITVRCTDAGGRTATRTTTVTVSHSQ